jgi:hypothetical protein
MFAVKKGKCVTYFRHVEAALAFARVILGAVIFIVRDDGRWEPLFR